MLKLALSPNAFRKFAEVRRSLLYWPRETCTYTGDASPSSDSQASVASAARAGQDAGVGSPRGISQRLGDHGAQLDAAAAPSSRPPPARPARSNPAGAHVSCDGRRRHVGRALLRVVPGTARGQFVVRSAPSPALGGVCRPDAPG